MVELPDPMATFLALVAGHAPFAGLFGPHIALAATPFAAIGGFVAYFVFR